MTLILLYCEHIYSKYNEAFQTYLQLTFLSEELVCCSTEIKLSGRNLAIAQPDQLIQVSDRQAGSFRVLKIEVGFPSQTFTHSRNDVVHMPPETCTVTDRCFSDALSVDSSRPIPMKGDDLMLDIIFSSMTALRHSRSWLKMMGELWLAFVPGFNSSASSNPHSLRNQLKLLYFTFGTSSVASQ